MNHTQRLVKFVGAVLCALGLSTGERFAQADHVLPVVSPRERPPVMNRCFLARCEPPEIYVTQEITPT